MKPMFDRILVASVMAAIVGTAAQAGAATKLPTTRSNFDAYWQSARSASAPSRTMPGVARLLPSQSGYGSIVDQRLGHATFLWGADRQSAAAQAPYLVQRRSETVARQHLSANAYALGLNRSTIDSAVVREVHDLGRGPIIVRFDQRHRGLPVVGRQLSVLMDRDLRMKSISGYFARAPRALDAANAARGADPFVLSPTRALVMAYADLGGCISESALSPMSSQDDAAAVQRFEVAVQAGDDRISAQPTVRRVYFAGPADELIAAYELVLTTQSKSGAKAKGRSADEAYVHVIAADDGRVLLRKSLTANAEFSYRVWADDDGIKHPFDGPLGNEVLPVSGPSLPRPGGVPMNHVTLSSGPISSNDPWLADDATTTRGNNVDAYVDLAQGDGLTRRSADHRAATTGARTFDYAIEADGDPLLGQSRLQQNAAIVNLFYINNWLHDWYYDNGFNEAAGNGQADNFGRGGLGEDELLAEGEDFEGRNNANMSTPPDGMGHPRMQMFLFDAGLQASVTLTRPAKGELTPVATADFGPIQFDTSGDVVLYDDATDTATDGCEPAVNAAALAGKIALIDRGTCTFSQKVGNANAAGAIAVLIANNATGLTPNPLGSTDGFDTGDLPVEGITQEAGSQLKTLLARRRVSVRMFRLTESVDGTLDNAVIAHEWMHHVSNRLIGDALGLINQQGRSMGEGWSDFSALLLTVRASDRQVSGNNQYQGFFGGAGSYVDADLFYGLRRGTYTNNRKVNPLTFKHIENGVRIPRRPTLIDNGVDNSEVHNSGEIWCLALWGFYTRLLNDPRYSFEQARERMKDYLIASLKITPVAPTFLEARDAVLAVTAATDPGDFRHAARAFARRGLGVGAVAPERFDESHSGVVESFVAFGPSFEVTDVSITPETTKAGTCDADGALDAGETASLQVTIRSTGSDALPAGATALVSSPDDVKFSDRGVISFPRRAPGRIALGSTRVTLKGAGPLSTLRLKLLFVPPAGTDALIPAPATIEQTLFVNYDLAPHTSSIDDVEFPPSSLANWDRTLAGDGEGWFPTPFDFLGGTGWYVPDNGSPTDAALVSPRLRVPAEGGLRLEFDHVFQTEFAGVDPDTGVAVAFDGGVIEASIDGGPWTDVFDLGAKVVRGTGYNSQVLAFGENPRPGFGGTNGDVEHVAIKFGRAIQNANVRLRFRMVTDEAIGDFGWLIDNLAVAGTLSPPFVSGVADDGVCAP